jgi:ATP-binding cassette subfamily B protein
MFRELATLFPFIRKYRLRYLLGFLLLVLTNGGQLLVPQILKQAVDMISLGNFTADAILSLTGNLLLLALVISGARFGWRYFIHGASRRIETELREKLFDHIIDLHAGFFSSRKTGDLIARTTNDMHAVRMASGMAFVAFTDGVFMTLAILFILFRQSPELALIIVVPLPLITVLIIFLGSFVGRRFKHVQETFASLTGIAQESITGIRVIKTFVKENYFLKIFGTENDVYLKANMELARLWGLFHPIVSFLAGITSVLLLYFGGAAVISGKLTPGEFVAFFSYLEMLIWPMIGAGFTVNLLQRGAAALARVNEILKEKPAIQSPPNAVLAVPRGNILVKDLTLAYGDQETAVLSNISFSITEGETYGIFGRTGSGKTSLINLLPRLFSPPPGTVLLDGRDVLSYDLYRLRSAFGVVPQDTFLFSDTLRENIAFGAPGPLDEKTLRLIADISTISRDVESFPKGFDTEIGERGLTLSGGQKQRVAISRALARDPNILIFDDALSAVDTETEEKILSGVLCFRRGKTNILISHRISTLSHCDRVLVLDKGRAVQEGPPEELARQPGLYGEIYHLQSVEAVADGEPRG